MLRRGKGTIKTDFVNFSTRLLSLSSSICCPITDLLYRLLLWKRGPSSEYAKMISLCRRRNFLLIYKFVENSSWKLVWLLLLLFFYCRLLFCLIWFDLFLLWRHKVFFLLILLLLLFECRWSDTFGDFVRCLVNRLLQGNPLINLSYDVFILLVLLKYAVQICGNLMLLSALWSLLLLLPWLLSQFKFGVQGG